MNRTPWIMLIAALASASGCRQAAGLDDLDFSEPPPTPSNLDPACIPSKGAPPVSEECGVFMALSGTDAFEGTKERPVATFKAAIEIAEKTNKRIVYACAETFFSLDSVVVPAGFAIFGGLHCQSAWEYIGEAAKTKIESFTPLVLLPGEGTTRIADVHAFDLTGVVDEKTPGDASIALLASGVTAEITRCDLTATDGTDGESGTTPAEIPGPVTSDDPAIRGGDGANACASMAQNPGGAGKANDLCPMSRGGDGGQGEVLGASSGANGQPVLQPNPNGSGLGGAGQGADSCTNGTNGAPGEDGAWGLGDTTLGTITASGFVGNRGKDGSPGAPGQGGGGGGAALGMMDCAGASGGGGGAGGCGGLPGTGGGAGGPSIGVVSLNARLTFTDVKITVGNGGRGGVGAHGQVGGVGGAGGVGGQSDGTTAFGCAGGTGGPGGKGGRGGGGRGGHSIGIAYKGEPPPQTGFVVTLGVGGEGGNGSGLDEKADGAPGLVAATFQFSD